MIKQNLYIVLLGGKHESANIEVHDIIPIIASDIPSSFQYFQQQWFGLKNGLHVDSWMKINGISYQGKNYQIHISDTPVETKELKLFLINLGAYIPEQFGEIHKYLVVAGIDENDAKDQGKLVIESNWLKPHTDAVLDIDDCLVLESINKQFIQLSEGEFQKNFYKNEYMIIK